MDLIIIIAILVVPAIAQYKVTSNYNKYKKVNNEIKLSGSEIARSILDANGLKDIYVVETPGTLSDHYDPSRKVVRLSKEIFHGETIAAASIAAHEVGHAIQDKEGYSYMRFRSMIFPLVNIATTFSYFLLIGSMLLEMVDLMYIAIALMSIGLLFQLVTLPVEFDASERAKKHLKEMNLIGLNQQDGAKNMLSAAAMTYVAGVLASVLELVRLLLIVNNNRD